MNRTELTEEDQVKYHKLHFDLQIAYDFIVCEMNVLSEFQQNILDQQFTLSQCLQEYQRIVNQTYKDIDSISKHAVDRYLDYEKKCQGKGSDK